MSQNAEFDQFLRAIAKDADDWFPRLVFGDWLIEQGDPRGEMLHLLRDLLRLDCKDRETKQNRYLELYHQGHTIPLPEFTNSLGMKFVLIPPGEFLMGSPPDPRYSFKQQAQSPVTITKGFWMSVLVVNQSQWKELLHTERWSDRHWGRDHDHFPANLISHQEAVQFCQHLTDAERTEELIADSQKYRLPTEAEWEFACRAGTQTKYSFGDDLSLLDDFGWYEGNTGHASEQRYHPRVAGLKKCNPWGLFDMHGNVWEWCLDLHQSSLPSGSDPCILETNKMDPRRLLRGGSWTASAGNCLSAFRGFDSDNQSGRWLNGMRVVLARIH